MSSDPEPLLLLLIIPLRPLTHHNSVCACCSCGQNVWIASPSCLHSFLHHQACPLPTTRCYLSSRRSSEPRTLLHAPGGFLPQQQQLRRRRRGSFPVLAVGVLVWHFVQYVCENSICHTRNVLIRLCIILIYMCIYIYMNALVCF